MIRERQVSCREVLAAHLERIERVNPKVNAICTLLAEQALSQAIGADDALARGVEPGPLYGLPIAVKDLAETRGIRTTSPRRRRRPGAWSRRAAATSSVPV